MTELYIDPDGLTAVAEVAHRQHEHVGRVADYISSTCSQFGAFSGVLNIFEGSYRSAVESALDGMDDGRTVASGVQSTVNQCRASYVETDHQVYDKLKVLLGTEEGFPPYQEPGSGNSHPAGPALEPPPPGKDVEDENFKLTKAPPYVNGPAGRLLPGPDTPDLPAELDPQEALKQRLLEAARRHELEQDYLQHRAEGMTPAEATAAARDNARTPTQRAEDHSYDVSQQRAEDAYDAAHDRALAEGRTAEEARDAGGDAAEEQHHADATDRGKRNDITDAGGTLLDGYNTASDTVDNVQDLIDHGQQLDETSNDLDDYDDYENGGSR